MAGLGVVLAVWNGEMPLGDSDPFWQVRAGLDTVSHGIPHVDHHSWTADGSPWTLNSWAWNIVLSLIYRAGGVMGLYLVGAALTVALALLVASLADLVGARPAPTFVAFALLGKLMGAWLYARPHVVDFLMLFLFILFVRRALSSSGRPAQLAALALVGLQLLWVNLHSGAILGPPLLAVAGVGVLVGAPTLRGSRAAWQRLALLILALAIACLATPYGVELLLHVRDVRAASAGVISEWAPTGFHWGAPAFGVVGVVIGLPAAASAWRGRRWDVLGVLLLLIALTLTAVRFAPMVVFLSTVEYALLLSRLNVRPVMWNRIAGVGMFVLLVFAGTGIREFGRPTANVWSPRLVGLISPGCRTLNDYLIGGQLLLKRPDVKVAWDGRNDIYGLRREKQVADMLDGVPGTVGRLDDAHVNCVLAPSSYGIVKQLSALPGWDVVARDSTRTLLVRGSQRTNKVR
jgi:hypothetical protein